MLPYGFLLEDNLIEFVNDSSLVLLPYGFLLEDNESDGNTKYHDGVTPEIVKFTATNSDAAKKIEVKPAYTKSKKQLMVATNPLLDVCKYATDVLGNLYEVKDNNLKLEFK